MTGPPDTGVGPGRKAAGADVFRSNGVVLPLRPAGQAVSAGPPPGICASISRARSANLCSTSTS